MGVFIIYRVTISCTTPVSYERKGKYLFVLGHSQPFRFTKIKSFSFPRIKIWALVFSRTPPGASRIQILTQTKMANILTQTKMVNTSAKGNTTHNSDHKNFTTTNYPNLDTGK